MGYCPFCGLGILARRQALDARLGAQARALGVLALGRWAGRWARRAGSRRWGARARRGRARGSRTGAQGAAGEARGRQVLGAGRVRPGRLGWPWAVHSVHSAHFRSVFFLSHQMNTVHCKIKFFSKKKIY